MRRLLIPAGLLVAIVAAIGVYGLALAAGQRPMNGKIELWGGPNGEACSADTNRIELAGDGTVAHLGNVEVTASNCAGDVLAGPADILLGTATFTAADGSSITVSYSGHQEPPIGTVSSYTTTHTVTTGTGRFSAASGTWTIDGTVDLAIGKLLGDVTGWLRY